MRADITVIGGGPGGYVAALRAAQKGAKTVIIEKNHIGGTCLNVGCIPTKSLLESTAIVNEVNKWNGKGIQVNNIEFELDKLMKRKNKIVNQLVKGVSSLIDKNEKISLIKGKAEIINNETVQVEKENGISKDIVNGNIIIATGSKLIEISQMPFAKEY